MRTSREQRQLRDSSAVSTGVAVLLSAVTTPVRASVQTGEPPNLAREGDPIGLTAEAGAGGLPTLRADPTRGVPPARLAGSARPNQGLTTVVTGHGLRYPVEISEESRMLPYIKA
ncbi:MAG: hypothetical protein ACLP53_17175 [Isosphaeraceae bacterium]